MKVNLKTHLHSPGLFRHGLIKLLLYNFKSLNFYFSNEKIPCQISRNFDLVTIHWWIKCFLRVSVVITYINFFHYFSCSDFASTISTARQWRYIIFFNNWDCKYVSKLCLKISFFANFSTYASIFKSDFIKSLFFYNDIFLILLFIKEFEISYLLCLFFVVASPGQSSWLSRAGSRSWVAAVRVNESNLPQA